MKYILLSLLVFGCSLNTGKGGSCIFSDGAKIEGLECTDGGWCMICTRESNNGSYLLCRWVNAYNDCRGKD